MLKLDKIIFETDANQSLTIQANQVESFPLIGGEEANMVNTQVWNQHGNTHVSAYMESFEGELIFAFFTTNLSDHDVLEKRRNIIEVCNPLNGTVKMQLFLSDGSMYSRDITFISAPFFPVGFENRNEDWQKVQLTYEANNPFWYSANEIIETFKSVEPLFQFPFAMSPTNPVIFGTMIPAKTAINDGQVEAPMTIRISGACVNPEIINETTGEFIRFKNLTMIETDVLEIDTTFGQKKVLLNGQNVFNKLDFNSTFFNLVQGENTIDFNDETGSTTASIHFIYRNLYITI
jgi:Siphovirus-type tail component, C-terminal domain